VPAIALISLGLGPDNAVKKNFSDGINDKNLKNLHDEKEVYISSIAITQKLECFMDYYINLPVGLSHLSTNP
jgi:hypothetical protein